MDTEERFATLVEALAMEPGVTTPDTSGRRRFGASALKVNGSIFAMLTRGELVVKLPQGRVRALVEERAGSPFDGGKGAPMKEWVIVAGSDPGRCLRWRERPWISSAVDPAHPAAISGRRPAAGG